MNESEAQRVLPCDSKANMHLHAPVLWHLCVDGRLITWWRVAGGGQGIPPLGAPDLSQRSSWGRW